MTKLVTDYLKTKENYTKQSRLIDKSAMRVFSVYCKYKEKVSTGPRWSAYNIDTISFKGYKCYLELYHSYNGGGGHTRYLSFPYSWFEFTDDELAKAVLERLEEERIDIEQREAKALEKREKARQEEELVILAKLKEKYPDM